MELQQFGASDAKWPRRPNGAADVTSLGIRRRSGAFIVNGEQVEGDAFSATATRSSSSRDDGARGALDGIGWSISRVLSPAVLHADARGSRRGRREDRNTCYRHETRTGRRHDQGRVRVLPRDQPQQRSVTCDLKHPTESESREIDRACDVVVELQPGRSRSARIPDDGPCDESRGGDLPRLGVRSDGPGRGGRRTTSSSKVWAGHEPHGPPAAIR